MTSELPGPSHRPTAGRRSQGPVGQLVRLFVSQLLAVLAVATVITAVFAVAGAGDRTPSDTDAAGTTSSPSPSGAAATSAAPTTAVPSSPSPSPSPTESTPTAPPRVDVLNQSAGQGDAATTAAGLEERGWRIGRVDDFTGTVSTTTIYFPPGRRADARELAREFADRPRLRPTFDGLRPNRLTVILVGDV